MENEPRLMTGKEAAGYCNVTPATWSKWVALGIVPPPLQGTRRWDRKAIDLALDKLSGIRPEATQPQEDDYTIWKRGYEAEISARAETDWEERYEERKARRSR